MRRLELALALALAAAPAAAQQAPARDTGDAVVRHRRDMVVSAAWLADHLRDPDVAVVQVGRDEATFRAGHIPGARFLPLAAVATTVNGVANEFPPRDALAATFRALGVGDRRIVLYDDLGGLPAARAWVALDLLGHGERAALLDGGMAHWIAAYRGIDTGAVALAPRPFPVSWRADRIATAEWVSAHLADPTVVFVDARPPEQYAGAEPPCPAGASCAEIPAERRGHLPGAKSLYWMTQLLSREDPVLKPMHALHEDLWKATGADRPGVRTVVTYCRTGMQASHDYFVARYVGYADVRLYDGSFSEWAALPAAGHPVERSGP